MTVPAPGDPGWFPAQPWGPMPDFNPPPSQPAMLSEILIELRAIRELLEKRDA